MAIEQVPTGDDTLVIHGDFLGFPPKLLFGYWVRPDLLKQWWPREATVDPRVEGRYQFSWPELGRTLTGTYTTFQPGRALAFTWDWEHTDDQPLTVSVTFEPLDHGADTRLTLTQGPYANTPHDQEERASHLEGWTYFLAKLQSLAPAQDWTGALGEEG